MEDEIIVLKASAYDQMAIVETNKAQADEVVRPYQEAINEALKKIGEINRKIQQLQNGR